MCMCGRENRKICIQFTLFFRSFLFLHVCPYKELWQKPLFSSDPKSIFMSFTHRFSVTQQVPQSTMGVHASLFFLALSPKNSALQLSYQEKKASTSSPSPNRAVQLLHCSNGITAAKPSRRRIYCHVNIQGKLGLKQMPQAPRMPSGLAIRTACEKSSLRPQVPG